MHYWGDDWFNKYGGDLYKAERYIYKYVRKTTGCIVVSKEKYGTIRYEMITIPVWFWRNLRFSIPFTRTKYGKKLWFFELSWLGLAWRGLGEKAMMRAIKQMVVKYPHLKKELTCGLDISKEELEKL